LAVNLLRGETNILVKSIFDVQIPVITDDAILPVPTKPKFITISISIKHRTLGKKKAPKKGAFKF
jgi:hypothetical protein